MISLLVMALALVLANEGDAHSREYTRRLRSPATIKDFTGGESHHSYVIRVHKGRTLSVQISWRQEHDGDTGNNHAEFFVGELPDFNGGGQVTFGRESHNGTRWS